MRPRRYLPIACTLLMICPGRAAPTSSYAQALSRLPRGACLALAGQSAIGPDGAIGRNRRGYFHVRFQLGLHHWADEAIAASDPEAADRFRRALDYALAHETPDGGFELQVPRGVSAAGPASQADLASGSAFFLSSAGAGLLALKGSAWFQSDPGSAACRRALSADEVPLRRALGRLKEEQRLLDAADANAPNRLLFDALAFISLGEALGDAGAVGIGRRYESSALALQAPEGYFIEGGGFDSSYNGVALAVGYRLLLIHPRIRLSKRRFAGPWSGNGAGSRRMAAS